ncbi:MULTISPECIES: hypothetical protein [Actinomycetes]|uniref:Uncharacterized protein n=2 Tax=Actinomycetes TaxID=1760 RepID=A0A5N8X8Y2_9ACTN|nr:MULTISPECIES: hypothetical protein [Actinomycetes]MPY55468.1 hypothetical protein [Streptomyces acidicola]GHF30875.1 hypothetical protein GCM10017786_75980 [Amycolatopsis deserti]
MSEGSSTPIIGVEQWQSRRPPAVGRVRPVRCPLAGHDLAAPGAVGQGWSPDGGGTVEYTCWACYRTDPRNASWRLARDEDAMWRAAALPRPGRQQTKYQGT